jgi:hypothetical protein
VDNNVGRLPPLIARASPSPSKSNGRSCLILDPLIRLHRVVENDATQIAALLSYLRELQRQFDLAVMLVHHARRDSHSSRPGQALCGSSELHGWGDSNLYLRRKGSQLTLSTEYRAAPSRESQPLREAERRLGEPGVDVATSASRALNRNRTAAPWSRAGDGTTPMSTGSPRPDVL